MRNGYIIEWEKHKVRERLGEHMGRYGVDWIQLAWDSAQTSQHGKWVFELYKERGRFFGRLIDCQFYHAPRIW